MSEDASTQIVDVTYSSLSGKCKYYDAQGKEFNGDLVCPPEGCTFLFQRKAGETGWGLEDVVPLHISGPTVSFTKGPKTPASMPLIDPGNGEQAESWYSYVLKLKLENGTVVSDPKIKNTGGGHTFDRQRKASG